jgi:hypothetical protein
VVASIVSVENGQEYSAVEQLTVEAPQQQGGGSGGGGGGGGGRNRQNQDIVDEVCLPDWSCTAWTECKKDEQKRVCVDLNKCSADSKTVEERSCMEEQEEDEDNDGDAEGNTVSAAREPLPEPEEHTVDATEEDQGNAGGIGKASGFMNLLDFSLPNMLLALLLMAVLVGTLYKYGWSKGDHRKKPAAVDFLSSSSKDKLGLESYLDDRMARKGR